MSGIVHDPSKWIAKDGARLLERYAVPVKISGSFLGIPLETQNHPVPATLDYDIPGECA